MVSPNWLQGAATSEERQRRSDLIRHSEATLELLTSIVEIELAKLTSAPLTDYNSPNWALLQADKQGQARVWKNILVLCNQEGKTHG